jgi:isoleucyl-tRNA synthetase
VNYAIIDRPDLSQPVPAESLQVTDRWLLARTAVMLDGVKRSYEGYDTPTVIRDVEAYLDDVSNWYVRVSRRRFWRSGHDADKRACYSSLLAALRATSLALAPIIPFITERIWQNAVRGLDPNAAESIHHADWPEVPASWRDEPLLRRTETVRSVIRLGLKVRAQANTRIRQPLRAAHVVLPAASRAAVEQQSVTIQSELNVKEIRFAEDAGGFFQAAVKVDWKAANAHFRRDAARFRQVFEALDATVRNGLSAAIAGGGDVTVSGFDQPVPAALFRMEREPDPRWGTAEEADLLIALDLEVPETLQREGMVRDLVRNLQVMRKDAGLSVSQRIELGLFTNSSALQTATGEHRDYIMDELLVVKLENAALPDAKARLDVNVEGETVHATMRW